MVERSANKQFLSKTLLYEITKALGFSQDLWVGSVISPLFKKAADHFAEIGVGLDNIVAREGVAAGARWVLPRFVAGFHAQGVENIPDSGPLVIASNHPAAYDSLVISAMVERPDYKIIVGDIPFFENLPNISKHAIYAPHAQDTHGRMNVIRECLRHLESGGALLIFPRGGIEPDPALMVNADSEFDLWSRSLEIFLKRVPQVKFLATIVSGVISKAAYKHPFTWFRKARCDRQRLAFMLQMIRQSLTGKEIYGLMPRVSFGAPVSGLNFEEHGQSLKAITDSARQLLHTHIPKHYEISSL